MSRNADFGRHAGYAITTANYNVMIGSKTDGLHYMGNIGIGYGAGKALTMKTKKGKSMRLKKSKVAAKGIEAGSVVAVVLLLAHLIDLDVDPVILNSGIVGLIGIYYAVKNWWKNR